MQKKQIKLMSFNVYCAPGMYDRLNRIDNLIDYFTTNTANVDIVCLQELNEFRTGIISMTIMFVFRRVFKYIPHMCTIWDFIALLEGVFIKYVKWLPSFVYKYETEQVFTVAKTLGFNYIISPPIPDRWLNTGTVILSKYSPSDIKFTKLTSDIVCAPGITKCTINVEHNTINIINCHLQPPCDYNSFKYIINRYINKFIFNKNIHQIVNENIETLIRYIEPNTVVLIDANTDIRSHNFSKLIKLSGLINTAENPLKPTCFDNIVIGSDVIDFVLSNIGGKSVVMDHITFSDHYPLLCTIDL